MSLISDFVERAEKYAEATGQSLSTVSRKLLNDGKGIARLKKLARNRGQALACRFGVFLYALYKIRYQTHGHAPTKIKKQHAGN